MEKDVLFLLLGAILGAVLGNIDKIIVFINKQINRWTIFHRNKLMKGLDVNKWLIEYYEKNKSSDELYNCKIGDFEVKIPFFSKPLWQFTESIDEDKNDLLVYSETINHFRVDKKIAEMFDSLINANKISVFYTQKNAAIMKWFQICSLWKKKQYAQQAKKSKKHLYVTTFFAQ